MGNFTDESDNLIYYIEVEDINPDNVEIYIAEVLKNIKRTYKIDSNIEIDFNEMR
jgi:predicted nuclease of predicted toxin-antitoxin system